MPGTLLHFINNEMEMEDILDLKKRISPLVKDVQRVTLPIVRVYSKGSLSNIIKIR
jgi:hypothetical protein